jgi:hypothetical protein
METNEIKIGLEIDKELHRRLKTEAASQGRKLKSVTREAFEKWLAALAGGPCPVCGGPADLTDDERRALGRTLAVLRSSNRDAIERVNTALEIGLAMAEVEIKKKRRR